MHRGENSHEDAASLLSAVLFFSTYRLFQTRHAVSLPAALGLQQAMFSLRSNGLPCGAEEGSRGSPCSRIDANAARAAAPQQPRRGPRPHDRRMRQRRRAGRHPAQRGLCGAVCLTLVAECGPLPLIAAHGAAGSQPGHLPRPCRGREQSEPACPPRSRRQSYLCGCRLG